MSNAPERHDHFEIRQCFDAVYEKASTGLDLRAGGFVLGRYAAHRICYHAIFKRQPVIGAHIILTGGEAKLRQGGVKQITGIIAGKRAAGAIGPFQPRRQSDNQKAGSTSVWCCSASNDSYR